MLVEIYCKYCNVTALTQEVENTDFATMLLLMTHAASSHKGTHPLDLIIDKKAVFDQKKVKVSFRCVDPRCKSVPMSDLYIPSEWMAAAAVLYHSSHEGHSIEWYVDGRKIWDGMRPA